MSWYDASFTIAHALLLKHLVQGSEPLLKSSFDPYGRCCTHRHKIDDICACVSAKKLSIISLSRAKENLVKCLIVLTL